VSLVAPTPFSVLCFRVANSGVSPAEQDALNKRILERINAEGHFFISHAVLRGSYTMRVAIGNIRTAPEHLDKFLDSLRSAIEAESPHQPTGSSGN
jgi:aromatic-L-amino-acid decarboxylase